MGPRGNSLLTLCPLGVRKYFPARQRASLTAPDAKDDSRGDYRQAFLAHLACGFH